MEKMQENANIKLFALHSNQALAQSYVMLQSNISVMVRSKSTSMKVCGEMMCSSCNQSLIRSMKTLWN